MYEYQKCEKCNHGYPSHWLVCNICGHGGDEPVKPDTSLSLLVIDLGHSVLMSHESGREFRFEMPSGREFVFDETCDQYLTRDFSFDQLRDAIDSQDKPVPRIERSWLGGYVRYTIFFHDTSFPLPNNPYEALSQLVGHDLPIWDGGGKWELVSAVEVDVWRYTRGGE